MMLTQTILGLLWSFLASAVFWLILSTAFGIKKNPIISVVFLSLLVFGLSILFDITSGLVFIMQTAWVSIINEQFTLYTLGAILAGAGIVSMIISAFAVMIVEAVKL